MQVLQAGAHLFIAQALSIEGRNLTVVSFPNPKEKIEWSGRALGCREEDNVAHVSHISFRFHKCQYVKTKCTWTRA